MHNPCNEGAYGEGKVCYEECDPTALKKPIETQHKVIDFQKKNKQRDDLFSIIIVVDDFADDPKFCNTQTFFMAYSHGAHRMLVHCLYSG